MCPPVLLLLLLGLVSSIGSALHPRTSFRLNSVDRPVVLFGPPDLQNATTLLLSDDGSTLYVGARDAVLSLDVRRSDVIRLKKKVEWRPSQSEINDCQSKGKNAMVDCPNFVSVLQQMNSTHLYVCGSFAFSPHDAFIDTRSFSMVTHADAKAKGRCPYSPEQRNTAISIDGELFTATTTDFRGVKPQISRHFSKDGRQEVSQDSSVGLLEEPTFVGSSHDPSGEKLYFFFSEVGKEFNFQEELRVSRVAQVCKGDIGGQRTLQNKWTSFAKASLLCQLPRQLPFNVLQDVFTLRPPEGADASDTLLYAVFTSQWSSAPESAVCVFKLRDIRAAFRGSYRTFQTGTRQLDPMPLKRWFLGQCGLNNASDLELSEVKTSFLTSSSVRGDAIAASSERRYSRVAAMRTQAADGKAYTVLFLLTESGFLHKVALLDKGAQVIEEIQVFTQPQLVLSIVISSSKGLVFVGTSEGVTSVPVARCSIYATCAQCVLARDPLCGWSRAAAACTGLEGRGQDLAQDLTGGDVEEQCREAPGAAPVQEVNVHSNEAVRLRCVKPSNLATLTWTSSRFKVLPRNLFITSADGGLSFLASAETVGSYGCVAQEAGHQEVVASYEVRRLEDHLTTVGQVVLPTDRGQVVLATKEPKTTYLEVDPTEEAGLLFTTDSSRLTPSGPTDNSLILAVTEARTAQLGEQAPKKSLVGGRSYHGELVVVSVLLASCVLVLALASLWEWRRRRAGPPGEGGETRGWMETVPSLSGPEKEAIE
ncbi:semaphorin-4B-like isoform X1 [Pungitius pungitius]|uniref:semaphorin-4B-like isoform X1 n=1 Tax=Pungitius pungitius TaxID=134920 RepID=UPI002E0DC483